MNSFFGFSFIFIVTNGVFLSCFFPVFLFLIRNNNRYARINLMWLTLTTFHYSHKRINFNSCYTSIPSPFTKTWRQHRFFSISLSLSLSLIHTHTHTHTCTHIYTHTLSVSIGHHPWQVLQKALSVCTAQINEHFLQVGQF